MDDSEIEMYLVPEDTRTPADDSPSDASVSTPRSPAKVTARMLKIRELIDQDKYPDRDVLAERIVEANKP
jgi:hypothetical protein